jgi:hypothetical protein
MRSTANTRYRAQRTTALCRNGARRPSAGLSRCKVPFSARRAGFGKSYLLPLYSRDPNASVGRCRKPHHVTIEIRDEEAQSCVVVSISCISTWTLRQTTLELGWPRGRFGSRNEGRRLDSLAMLWQTRFGCVEKILGWAATT